MMGTVSDTPTPTPDDPAVDPAADPAAPPADAPAAISFTDEQKAHIEQQMAERVRRAEDATRKKLEAEITALGERAKMDDVARAQAERADAEKAAADTVAKANDRLKAAEAKAAAIAAGVKADRVALFLRNVDLDEVTVADDGTPDTAAVAAAVAAALTIVPEFASPTTPAPPSGGDFGGSGSPKVWTRAEIAKLTPAEFEKHEAEITKQLQSAGVS